MTQVASLVNAFDAFISGCKLDGTWSSIKASCIMAGWSNLSGALTPLAGAAPSGFNLASGTYIRASGLKGDGVSMYLNSNRADNADPQNSAHLAFYVSSAGTGGSGTTETYAGAGDLTGSISFRDISRFSNVGALNSFGTYNRFNSFNSAGDKNSTGFIGNSRSSSANFVSRLGGSNTTVSAVSRAPSSTTLGIFAERIGGAVYGNYATCRLSFYSIGESLNLALLDNRVTVLMSGIQNAIP